MSDSKSEIVVYSGADRAELVARGEPVTARNAPAIIKAAGRSAEFAWEEFFQAEIANAHTRKNYLHAVRKFLAWVEERGLDLPRVTPGDVGAYLKALPISTPTKKLHLAALRRFFDRLVNRHACVINPAATVKAERYAVIEGKTPQIGPDQVRTLLKSITSLSTRANPAFSAGNPSNSPRKTVKGNRGRVLSAVPRPDEREPPRSSGRTVR
jgi:Phage integrase, N-terminal SAM-like domain